MTQEASGSKVFDLELSFLTNQWAKEVSWNIERRWENSGGVEGNAEVSVDLPYVSAGNVVEYIRAQGRKAWILEYGSGSKSDTGSPYLDSYVSDKNFNHYRSKGDMRIRGRDAGEYSDLDGGTQVSSGRNAGKDLEAKPVYEPQIPLHIIQEEIEKEIPTLRSRIAELVPELIARELSITMDVTI